MRTGERTCNIVNRQLQSTSDTLPLRLGANVTAGDETKSVKAF